MSAVKKVLTLGTVALATVTLAACGSTEMSAKPDKPKQNADLKAYQEEQAAEQEQMDEIDQMLADDAAAQDAQNAAAADDSETAKVGDSITLDAGTLKLQATLQSVTNTITPVLDEYGFGDEAGRGMRFAGVTLTVKNIGSEPWDAMYGENILVMRDDTEAEDAFMTDTPPWDSMPEAKVRPGKTLKVNLPFEVPKSGKLGRFQMTVMSDKSFDEFTGEWDM